MKSLPKFATNEGEVLDIFNDFTEFPATTYPSGKQVHYVPSTPGGDINDVESGTDAFTEHRMEMGHTTDLRQEVLEEVDGINVDQKLPYVEQVYGTLVGNSMLTTRDMRQYGRVLKPKIFSDFASNRSGRFQLEVCDRSPTSDTEAYTAAGAYLFRIRTPKGRPAKHFVAAVSKQGKFFLQAPGSVSEGYPSGTKNVSGEINLEGALKAYIGASKPDNTSLYVNLDGGIAGVIGHNASGNAIDIRYRSAVKVEYDATIPNDEETRESGAGGVAYQEVIKGVKRSRVTGSSIESVGSKAVTVDGGYQVGTDRYNLNAHSGYSMNCGEKNEMVSGKTQYHHALQVIETIVAGGRQTTVLAGGMTTTVAAGAWSTTLAAGSASFNIPAGGYTVTVGTGAIALSTASGALSLTAGAGAISLTSGAAMSLTSTGILAINSAATISMVSPQVLVGGPAAVLGVCRGVPSLPPGTPSLDPITGIPLMGSALFRSL